MKRWAMRRLAMLLYRPAWLIATVVLNLADLLPGSRPPWVSAEADPLVERPATDVLEQD